VRNRLPDHHWQRFPEVFVNTGDAILESVRDMIGGMTTVVRTIIDVTKDEVD
jgi:hypothetical protein